MTLGDIIKKYREENSTTMDQVASLCGITKGYVAMLERNVNSKTGKPVKPTLETILKVCKGLHLDVDEVFDNLDDDYVVRIPGRPSSDPALSAPERKLLDNYRSLNPEGQGKASDYLEDLVASGRYTVADNLSVLGDGPISIAAHERTDIEVTDEMREHDMKIMLDDDF